MKASKIFKYAAITGGALLAAKGLDNRLEVTHYTIASKKIPKEFDGFRIVQISDLHAQTVPGIVGEIKSENPDIIVSTGDLVHDTGSVEPAISLCKKLTEIAPVYAVSGNHDVRRSDYTEYMKKLQSTGVATLCNTSKTLFKNGDMITLSGISDPFSEDRNNINATIENSVNVLDSTDNYHILLFHRANHMDLLQNGDFDLILSGHMHGGQVRLPGGRGVCAPKSSWGSGYPMLFPKYFAGHYRNKETDMIVNRGIGNPMIVPRLFNRPEITVIILKSAN